MHTLVYNKYIVIFFWVQEIAEFFTEERGKAANNN